jgi:hypothetical protein
MTSVRVNAISTQTSPMVLDRYQGIVIHSPSLAKLSMACRDIFLGWLHRFFSIESDFCPPKGRKNCTMRSLSTRP